MTLLELVTYLRKNILDDTGGEGATWEDYDSSTFDAIQLRWDNEELVSNINEAINQVYRRIHPIKDLMEFDIESGVNEYLLPSYLLKIDRIKRENGLILEQKDIDDLWKLKDFNTYANDPKFFILNSITNNIRIYPTPLSDETLTIFYYRLPKVKLDWLDNSESPELREEYQLPMLFYAAYLCYIKDDPNTLDPQRSNSFLTLFEREFPFTSAYSNLRKSRTANRPVRYGGI